MGCDPAPRWVATPLPTTGELWAGQAIRARRGQGTWPEHTNLPVSVPRPSPVPRPHAAGQRLPSVSLPSQEDWASSPGRPSPQGRRPQSACSAPALVAASVHAHWN